MKIRGLASRWTINTMLVVTVLVLVLAVIVSYAVRSIYYNSVKNTLSLKDGEVITTYFNVNSGMGDAAFNETARDFVENFSDKNIMGVWVIRNGAVVVSSSGFTVTSLPDAVDYNMALKSGASAYWMGNTASGEKYMAMTTPIALTEGTAAIRYLISLEEVDEQLRLLNFVICFAGLFLILIIFIPGMLFIRSTVTSIKEINVAAEKIAEGKLDTRVEKSKHDDEIGVLCDTINNMANEISAADKMKNDFISTISHELRTPLTAIKGWGETLAQIGDDDQELTKRGMDVIINESGRLAVMVEELLDFSRMQSGRLSLRIEKIDVLAELDETVFSFKERAIRDGKELSYNAINLPAPMEGDPNRIKQVFVNILDNALKYTQTGGKIHVEARLSTPTVLEITVSDTGNGISQEDLLHVKEKFYKADMSARGSGIGLAVVDEIVKLHKGEWTINSVLGKGTTVTILLPVEETILPDERGLLNEQQV